MVGRIGGIPIRLHPAFFVLVALAVAGGLGPPLEGVLWLVLLAVYVVFLAVNAAVIVLRGTAPDAPRPFRSPFNVHGVPVLAVVGSLAALAMVPQLETSSLWLGLALLVAGLLAYRLLGHSDGDCPTEQQLVDANRRSVRR